MMEMLEKTAAALERRHFKAAVFKTAQEAASFILSDMPTAHPLRSAAVPPVSRWGWLSSCAKMGMRFSGIGKSRPPSVPRCFIRR